MDHSQMFVRSFRDFFINAVDLEGRYMVAGDLTEWNNGRLLGGHDVNLATKPDATAVPLRSNHMYVIAESVTDQQFRLDAVHPRVADLLVSKGIARIVNGADLTLGDFELAARVEVLERMTASEPTPVDDRPTDEEAPPHDNPG